VASLHGRNRKILSPAKMCLLPDLEAGCSLLDGLPRRRLRRLSAPSTQDHLWLKLYINCSAGGLKAPEPT